MARKHVGNGWKTQALWITPHVEDLERNLQAHLGEMTRSALVATAVAALSRTVAGEGFAYPERGNHLRDYAELVVRATPSMTRVHMKDETVAQLDVIGKAFEAKQWKMLLKGTLGYNHRMLVYIALRWYAEHLTQSEQMC